MSNQVTTDTKTLQDKGKRDDHVLDADSKLVIAAITIGMIVGALLL